MGGRAVGQDGHHRRPAAPAGLGDQAAAAQTLVVRMGRQHQEAAGEHLVQIGDRQRAKPLENGGGGGHVRSRVMNQAAASVRVSSGAGWRR
jgi:hypothetical protein